MIVRYNFDTSKIFRKSYRWGLYFAIPSLQSLYSFLANISFHDSSIFVFGMEHKNKGIPLLPLTLLGSVAAPSAGLKSFETWSTVSVDVLTSYNIPRNAWGIAISPNSYMIWMIWWLICLRLSLGLCSAYHLLDSGSSVNESCSFGPWLTWSLDTL